MLNLIIFIGIVIGSYFGVFDNYKWFDEFMHIMAGMVCAVFGYDFAVIIQRKKGQCAATLAAMDSAEKRNDVYGPFDSVDALMEALNA